jgi:hypothetical protein
MVRSRNGSSKAKKGNGPNAMTTISRKNIREDRKYASLWNFSKSTGDTLKKEMVLYLKAYFDTLRWNPNRVVVLDCEKGEHNLGIKLPTSVNTSTRNHSRPRLRLSFASPSVMSAFVSCLEVYVMTHLYNASQYLPIRLILNDLHINDTTAPLLLAPKVSMFLMQLDLSNNCLGPVFIDSLATHIESHALPYLKVLNLKGNRISGVHVERMAVDGYPVTQPFAKLMTALARDNQLLVLDISCNLLGGLSQLKSSPNYKNSEGVALFPECYEYGDRNLDTIITFLTKCTSIESLNLLHNGFTLTSNLSGRTHLRTAYYRNGRCTTLSGIYMLKDSFYGR